MRAASRMPARIARHARESSLETAVNVKWEPIRWAERVKLRGLAGAGFVWALATVVPASEAEVSSRKAVLRSALGQFRR